MIIYLFIALLFAAICYRMAEKRGRNPVMGAIGGALFGILAVVYYLIAGNTDQKKAEIMRDVMGSRN